MKEYDFKKIEENWQQVWRSNGLYKVSNDHQKPKCYVLDMFPYPSGAGLHVGHPLGYIASDIYSRYKRLKGYNVLHPMGYDSFGLPAEQYAIQTGQHPAITTKNNIKRYREQLDKIGFCYDWEREVRTSDPSYYKWTQWIFIQLYNSWYNYKTNKAEPIETLIEVFEKSGYRGNNDTYLTGGIELDFPSFSPTDWKGFNETQRLKILLGFRLAYLSEAYVNWCPQLGTVLSNDEVKDGVSERGGYPVERKLMNQWSMRITAYADRLLKDLDGLDWSESLKETQRNWIGKSQGASLNFKVQDSPLSIEVFTTRPDTIFGATFLVIAPEHDMLEELTSADCMHDVMSYLDEVKNRSERERQTEVKRISGEFTGAYAIHPFTGEEIPIWVADYVLAGYGTGAVMAVPAHDSRDFAFAKHFNLPIKQVVKSSEEIDFTTAENSYDAKEGVLINSDFLNGLDVKSSIKKAIEYIEKQRLGKGKTNFRLRDAIFGRQRYWGEPIPVYYKEGIPYCLPSTALPLVLPDIDKFLPTEDGEPPLARAEKWMWNEEKQCVDAVGYPIETTTMPGWAGSSWYFLRYMDPQNEDVFVGSDAVAYWKNVDLYLGGSEHATGHLLYVRFWTKFLFDRGFIPMNEPAQKLINQGMIQGMSEKIYRVIISEENMMPEAISVKLGSYPTPCDVFVSAEIVDSYLDNFKFQIVNIPIENVSNAKVNLERLVKHDLHLISDKPHVYFVGKYGNWYKMNNSVGELEYNLWSEVEVNNSDDSFTSRQEIEKMSKSKWNVVTPDTIVDDYGADTLRLYEMFLGPLEQSKPWSTQGIEGVHRFLKKVWRMFFNQDGMPIWTNDAADKKELKSLHKLIKKVGEDIEGFSFNTSVSSFMICVNELSDLKCNKKDVLSDFLICLHPYAPHITEELWKAIGNADHIANSTFPTFNADYLIEDSFSYPISINGKHRTNIEFSLQATAAEVEQAVLADETVQKWLEGKAPKKVIFVKGKIVNVVI